MAAGSFFLADAETRHWLVFDGQPDGRRMAAFSKDERDKLLRDAYACNKPNKSPEEQNECRAREEAARSAIAERIRANHQAAKPSIEEARRISQPPPP